MSDRPPPRVTQQNSGSGKTGLALIVGGLVVAVAVLAFILFGGAADDSDDVNVTVEGGAESVDDAGEAVEGAAEDAGEAVEGAAESVEDSVEPAETD